MPTPCSGAEARRAQVARSLHIAPDALDFRNDALVFAGEPLLMVTARLNDSGEVHHPAHFGPYATASQARADFPPIGKWARSMGYQPESGEVQLSVDPINPNGCGNPHCHGCPHLSRPFTPGLLSEGPGA